MVPTIFAFIVSGVLTATVGLIQLLSPPVGSIIAQGHLFFDSTSNSAPQIYMNTYPVVRLTGSSASLVYGGESYETPARSPLTLTGANKLQASILNPIPAATGGSGGIVTFLSVECGGLSTARNMTIAVNSINNHGTGGTVIASRKSVHQGVPFMYSGSTILVPSGSYLNLETATGSAIVPATADCLMKAVFSQKHGTH